MPAPVRRLMSRGHARGKRGLTQSCMSIFSIRSPNGQVQPPKLVRTSGPKSRDRGDAGIGICKHRVPLGQGS